VSNIELAWELKLAGKLKFRSLMLAMCCCFAVGSIWLSAHWWPYAPHDYEECSEKAETTAPSKEERASLLTQCDEQFLGRRKRGGGYSYHDFMQNRHFDIAGPNPSPEELKQIDHEYIAYLALQRRDAIAVAFAKKQSERTKTDPEPDQKSTGSLPDVGPPMVITPTNLPVTGRPSQPVDQLRAARCDDGSLSCNWSKFSAGVKNAFGSSSKTKP
jgi:hypothetical protein